jgi:hypothetical protein
MNPRKVEVIHDADFIAGDPDALPVGAALKPSAMPILDDAGEAVKVDQLPLDFPANAKAVGDGSYILALDYPVTLRWGTQGGEEKSQEYKQFHLKRLDGRKHKLVRDATPDMFRPTVLSVMAEDVSIGRAVLLEERMDPADMAAVLIVFRFFTTPGRRTAA